jgi:hypothetical protein
MPIVFLDISMKIPEVQDSQPTVIFIRIINRLLDMLINSRNPIGKGYKRLLIPFQRHSDPIQKIYGRIVLQPQQNTCSHLEQKMDSFSLCMEEKPSSLVLSPPSSSPQLRWLMKRVLAWIVHSNIC